MAIKDIFLPIMVGIPAQLLLIFIKTGSWMFRPQDGGRPISTAWPVKSR